MKNFDSHDKIAVGGVALVVLIAFVIAGNQFVKFVNNSNEAAVSLSGGGNTQLFNTSGAELEAVGLQEQTVDTKVVNSQWIIAFADKSDHSGAVVKAVAKYPGASIIYQFKTVMNGAVVKGITTAQAKELAGSLGAKYTADVTVPKKYSHIPGAGNITLSTVLNGIEFAGGVFDAKDLLKAKTTAGTDASPSTNSAQ